MSPDLADRISATINQWLADNGGGMPTGFTTIVDYFGNDGEPAWSIAHADGQTVSTTLGLLRWATIATERDARDYMAGE